MHLKPFLVLLWAIAIIIATCTSDAHAFLFDGVIDFSFNASPNLADLLIVDDIDYTDSFYSIQKTGHFLSFALLYALLFNWLKKLTISAIIAVGFAMLTEVLQLYFERDGRLFDVIIDILGILVAILLIKKVLDFKRDAAEGAS